MTTIVTIKSTTRVAVISERIVDDGRERHENGVDFIEPSGSMDFIVHDTQSIRVLEAPAPAAPAEAEQPVEPEQPTDPIEP